MGRSYPLPYSSCLAESKPGLQENGVRFGERKRGFVSVFFAQTCKIETSVELEDDLQNSADGGWGPAWHLHGGLVRITSRGTRTSLFSFVRDSAYNSK